MKALVTWIVALILGFLGGLLGQRFGSYHEISAELKSPTRASAFELVDRSGNVVSTWGVDQWGRPHLAMGDRKWEGRIVIGPLGGSDVVSNEPPDPDIAWGISVTAPSHAAYATLGTSVSRDTKQPTGFVALHCEYRTWMRDASREQLIYDESPCQK